MANADAPMGLKPLRYLSGAPYNGAVNTYYIPASDTVPVYIGQLVKLAGGADADGVASVTGAVATGEQFVGVCVGIARADRDSAIYSPASTEDYIFVADDPNLVFGIQEDSTGGALAATSVGQVADIATPQAGSATTGLSSMELDSSSATGTPDSTEDLIILGLEPREDNEIGVNANWMVKIQNHAFAARATGL